MPDLIGYEYDVTRTVRVTVYEDRPLTDEEVSALADIEIALGAYNVYDEEIKDVSGIAPFSLSEEGEQEPA